MSVEATQWRFVGRQNITAATWAGVMDAIFTLGQSSTYADGTTRTPGSGSAATWSRFQNAGTTEAVYCTPAVSPLNHRIIFAARSTLPSPTPTMASPDSWQINTLLVNVIKNAGAFNAWNASAPFTSGQTFGYWRCHNSSVTSLTGTVNLWESRDCIALIVLGGGGANTNVYAIAGALIDPESTDIVSDSETDGKLYGMFVGSNYTAGGFDSAWGGWLGTYDCGSGGPQGLTYLGVNGQPHAGVFTPNSSTIIPIYRSDTLLNCSGGGTLLYTRSGRIVRRPITFASSTHTIGRLREILFFPDSRVPRRFLIGGSPVGYVFGPSDSADVNCLLLEH